jgi:hypothetical protein
LSYITFVFVVPTLSAIPVFFVFFLIIAMAATSQEFAQTIFAACSLLVMVFSLVIKYRVEMKALASFYYRVCSRPENACQGFPSYCVLSL